MENLDQRINKLKEKYNLRANTEEKKDNLFDNKEINSLNKEVYSQNSVLNNLNNYINQFINDYHKNYDDKVNLKQIRLQELNNSSLKYRDKIYMMATVAAMSAFLYIGTGALENKLTTLVQLLGAILPTAYVAYDFIKNKKLFENQKILKEFEQGIYQRLLNLSKDELLTLSKENKYDTSNNLEKNSKDFKNDKQKYANNLAIYDKVIINEMLNKRLKEIKKIEKYPKFFKFKNNFENIIDKFNFKLKNMIFSESHIKENQLNRQISVYLIDNKDEKQIQFKNYVKQLINNYLQNQTKKDNIPDTQPQKDKFAPN